MDRSEVGLVRLISLPFPLLVLVLPFALEILFLVSHQGQFLVFVTIVIVHIDIELAACIKD